MQWLKGTGHCTSAKRMTSILRHVAEAFPSAWQGTVLKLPSSHRHCCQYLNGATLRLNDLHKDDSRCRTAGYSLTSYPRTNLGVSWFWAHVDISKSTPRNRCGFFTICLHICMVFNSVYYYLYLLCSLGPILILFLFSSVLYIFSYMVFFLLKLFL